MDWELSLGLWESKSFFLAIAYHFDCTFHLEWMRWRRKQTTRFLNVGHVCLMNSFCCTFFSWQMITNLCSLSLSLSPFIFSTPNLSPHLSSYAPSSLFSSPDPFFNIFHPSICILSAGTDLFSNCTEECKALGHSDRCWMPSFMPSEGRQGPDYRSNLHVPGMDATLPDTEVPPSVNLSDQLTMTSSTASSNDRSFSTFGKDGQRSQSHHSLHHLLHQQQQQYNSSTLERKEYDRGTLPYKPTFLCEYQYENSLGPYDFVLVQYRY